jgi:hypothetical protein
MAPSVPHCQWWTGLDCRLERVDLGRNCRGCPINRDLATGILNGGARITGPRVGLGDWRYAVRRNDVGHAPIAKVIPALARIAARSTAADAIVPTDARRTPCTRDATVVRRPCVAIRRSTRGRATRCGLLSVGNAGFRIRGTPKRAGAHDCTRRNRRNRRSKRGQRRAPQPLAGERRSTLPSKVRRQRR